MLQTRKISVLTHPESGCLHPELLSFECVGSSFHFFRSPKSLDGFRTASDLQK